MNALERATHALRAFPDDAPSPVRATLAEIVGSIRAAHSVRYPKLFALAACFVLFAASTAWGARPGKPLHRAYRAVIESFERTRTLPLPRHQHVAPSTGEKPTTHVEAIVETKPSASMPVVITPIVAPTPQPKVVRAEDLYRAAHRLHFVDADMNGALAAWNRYLALAPNGPFAPEAKYNRAIALARLGRKSEAIAALRPFADGSFGDYRRDEARKLIDALE